MDLLLQVNWGLTGGFLMLEAQGMGLRAEMVLWQHCKELPWWEVEQKCKVMLVLKWRNYPNQPEFFISV